VAFGTLIAAGAVLLATPLSAASGSWTSPIDALFTAVSAATDTGLVVVDTADHWSPFGQVVIAALMFLGGIGIMASATLAVFLGRASLERRAIASDAIESSLGGARDIIRGTVAFAVVVQLLGATALVVLFLTVAPSGAAGPLWSAGFHAISAFNNAGFDLIAGGRGFSVFADQPAVLIVVAALIVVGGLGFVVCLDIARKRRWRSFALETKLVIVGSIVLVAGGAVLVALFEWSNPATLGQLDAGGRVVNATFASVTARSAGLAAFDYAAAEAETTIVTMILMFIGAASGSTGGGIRVGTLAVLVVVAVATASRGAEPTVFGRRIAIQTTLRAVTVVLVSAIVTFVGWLAVTLLGDVPAGATLFEVISAISTTGLSTDGTDAYGDSARLALAACMFLGRLGPLALIILVFGRRDATEGVRRPTELVRVG
jgi:trk system potassium uptake protein TrkH